MKDKKRDTSLAKKDERSLTNVNYQRDRLFKKGINLMADEKLEEAVENLVRWSIKQTGLKNICIAGGNIYSAYISR